MPYEKIESERVRRSFLETSAKGTFSDYVNKYPSEVARLRSFSMKVLQPEGKTCLSVGCGMGGYLEAYRMNGARMVVGVDINRENLMLCKKTGAGLLLSDIEHLSIRDDVVDALDCVEAMQYPPNPEIVMQEVYRILKKRNGISFITWKHHDMGYWLKAFQDRDVSLRAVIGIRDLILDKYPAVVRKRMRESKLLSPIIRGYATFGSHTRGFSFRYVLAIYKKTTMEIILLKWINDQHTIVVVGRPATPRNRLNLVSRKGR